MVLSRRSVLQQAGLAIAAAAMVDPRFAFAREELAGFLDTGGDEMLIGGKPLSFWIETLDLPMQISYGPQIVANVRAFRETFERLYPEGEIRYAGKADTHPRVFAMVAKEGAGIDVASPFETRAALDAGLSGEKLDVNGNSKSDTLLKLALDHDMLVVVDSIEELEYLAGLAHTNGKRPRALLRLSGYQLGTLTADAIFTAGEWTKFGIALDDIPSLLPRLSEMPVKVIGFHTHIGSQITDPNAFEAVLGKMLDLGAALSRAGHEFSMVNVGGGFPVSYVSAETWQETIERIRDGYIAALAGDPSRIYLWENRAGDFALDADNMPGQDWLGEVFTAPYAKEKMLERLLLGEVTVGGRTVKTLDALDAAGRPTLVVEPGRAIVSDAGLTFARVAFLKAVAHGHHLVQAEIGTTFYGEALVATPVRHFALANEPNRRDDTPFETFVAGNLCFNGDMIARVKVPLQRRPQRGDVMMIANTGAYNPTFFAATANSFPRPARIVVEPDGTFFYTKRRDTYEEVFSLSS
ncbi:MAG: alanine racemase [Devosia sp.]